MVPTGNKAKRLSSVNHTTKTIHHHHHDHQNTDIPTKTLKQNTDTFRNYTCDFFQDYKYKGVFLFINTSITIYKC